MSRPRHRPPSGAPLSTKIVVVLGLTLVVGGFGLAGWERLGDDDPAEPNAGATSMFSTNLPDVRTVAVYVLVVAAAAIAGAYILIRSRRRGNDL